MGGAWSKDEVRVAWSCLLEGAMMCRYAAQGFQFFLGDWGAVTALKMLFLGFGLMSLLHTKCCGGRELVKGHRHTP